VRVESASWSRSEIAPRSNLPELDISSYRCRVCRIDRPFRKWRGRDRDIWREFVLLPTSFFLRVERESKICISAQKLLVSKMSSQPRWLWMRAKVLWFPFVKLCCRFCSFPFGSRLMESRAPTWHPRTSYGIQHLAKIIKGENHHRFSPRWDIDVLTLLSDERQCIMTHHTATTRISHRAGAPPWKACSLLFFKGLSKLSK